MDRKCRKIQLRRQRYNRQRILAFCLVFCLILSNLNFGSLLIYATEGSRKTFEIGSDVKAVLKDGVLTVKGYGDTRDFSRDTSPFGEYADEIRTLVIEDGITYIGSYLFYGLGGLQGELILPESIVGIGDYAFSGDSLDQAARFTVIRNEFEGGEITEWKKTEPEESEPVPLATPSQAEKVNSEELTEDDGEKGESDGAGAGNGVNAGDKEETRQEGAEQAGQGETEKGGTEQGRTEQGRTEQGETEKRETEQGKTEQEKPGRTEQEETEQEETGRTEQEEAVREEADLTEKEGMEREEATRIEQEGTGREEAARTEQEGTEREEDAHTEQEQTARKDTFPAIARIENHRVPFVGEGLSEGSSDSSGSESGSDTNSGSTDTSGGGADTSGGSADTSGGGADTSGGSADTSGGGADTNGGSADTSGGGTDTSGGSADTSGGSADTNGGNAGTSGGSADTNDGGTNTNGGSPDTVGGNADTGNTGQDITGNTPGSSGSGSDLPGNGSSQGSGGQEGGLSKDEGADSEGNTEAGDAAGTPEEKPEDTAPGDNPDQDLPSESESGTGGKGSRPKTEPESLEDEKNENPDFDIEYISQQKIENPETLFCEGQTGMVICSSENDTFIEAAEYAGYVMADSCVTVMLDDMEEMELPARDGQVCLPECPEDIKSPWDDNALFTAEFAGWSLEPGADPTEALAPGTFMDTGEEEYLNLYSVWKTIGTYQMSVKAERQGETAIYSLIDKETGETVKSLDGYAFSYQWQYSAQSADNREDKRVYDENGNLTENHGDGDDSLWEDIAGENSPVYNRSVEAGDIAMRFRCAVTPLRMTRSMTAASPDTLYSEPVNGVAVLQTVYVAQTSGDDSNSGIEDAPVKTLEAAAEKLKSRDEGGTADSNQIILMEDYDCSPASGVNIDFLKNAPVPVTIKGSDSTKKLLGTYTKDGCGFQLYEDVAFESLTINDINHIYGKGYNISIKDHVSCKGLYLYGASSDGNGTPPVKPGKIEVHSGNIARIVGYIRSRHSFEANNYEAVIIVDGTATVDSIVAGSASGEIQNGNVSIYIKGGTVNRIIGGCQGFSNVEAPYSGKTAINISGGTVTTVYGAGSGRETGIPTYQGTLDINVTGGNVSNIYGSGSAAYVVSNEKPTEVNISVSEGTVDNIYAAGVGGDAGVNGGNNDNGTPASDFGSLTGKANITIDNAAVITGNIYAGGKGYTAKDYGQGNAYLNGDVNITVNGGIVKGNIYGGGEGVNAAGFEKSARVCENSKVTVEIKGGLVEGYVYGGGKVAEVEGSTNVIISGGTIKGNVYGGGEAGLTDGKTMVHMANGTVNGSIYGGALGKVGDRFVYGGSTVNMTGGWVRGNVYGGSELSDDGKSGGQDEKSAAGLVFVNMTGGTVSGKVFGGGFQGIVNGSTHVHIGLGAIGKCNYYKSYEEEKPVLDASNLSVGGSVYAGGDYGGDGDLNYNTITVKGFSHVYIDGTDYSFGPGETGGRRMDIAGGVFGSGASCDAGDVRLVTLDHFGAPATGGQPEQVTGAVTSIQRADQVRLIGTHVRLAGQSDVANFNQTALYSLNRIGDNGNFDKLGKLGNGLVLEGGSTLVLDSASNSVANLKSMDEKESTAVTQEMLGDNPNTVVLATGTVFRISNTSQADSEEYGAVTGYFYMIAGDTAEAYAFARAKTEDRNTSDGGFVVPGESDELRYTNIGTSYRYWKVAGENASATRHVVLTARNADSPVPGTDGFAVAEGTIELPPVDAAENIRYAIQSITLSDKMTLADAAINLETGEWIKSGTDVNEDQEKTRIKTTPASTFGLLLRQNTSDSEQVSMVISDNTSGKDGSNSIIGKDWKYHVLDQEKSGIPIIEFNLTYYNDGIHISQNLGTVSVVMERYAGDTPVEEITMNVEIVTRASALSEQTVDLYASESGSYTGRMVIPADSSRNLSLAGVKIPGDGISLKAVSGKLEKYEVAVTLQPVQSQGWNTANLMSEPYDISMFNESDGAVLLGTTDSRYEAPIDFVLYNNGDFAPKDTDQIILTLSDGDGNQVPVTLNIHWKESIVSSVRMTPGKQYDIMNDAEKVEITRESSVTAAFTLGSQNGTISASSVWLELQDSSGTRCALPPGTKLTLMSGNSYYLYTIAGDEQDGKIPLDRFTEMWGSNKFTENIASKTLTVITAFDKTGGLAPGEYSLRLRNDTGADSVGGYFTVNNSTAAITLDSQEGLARGEHLISISVSPQQDTRLSDRAAVVLSAPEGEDFPKGTVFIYGEKRCYPVDGRIYLILDQKQEHTVVMDTTHTAGLPPGNNRISTQLFGAGVNAGKSTIASTELSYNVKANPVYGLSVKAGEGAERVTAPGTAVGFTVTYSMEHVTQKETIQVEVRRKEDGVYIETEAWDVKGDLGLVQGDGTKIGGDAAVTITVPADAVDGTYRLIFRLGDQTALYNIIIRG